MIEETPKEEIAMTKRMQINLALFTFILAVAGYISEGIRRAMNYGDWAATVAPFTYYMEWPLGSAIMATLGIVHNALMILVVATMLLLMRGLSTERARGIRRGIFLGIWIVIATVAVISFLVSASSIFSSSASSVYNAWGFGGAVAILIMLLCVYAMGFMLVGIVVVPAFKCSNGPGLASGIVFSMTCVPLALLAYWAAGYAAFSAERLRWSVFNVMAGVDNPAYQYAMESLSFNNTTPFIVFVLVVAGWLAARVFRIVKPKWFGDNTETAVAVSY